MAGIIGRMDDGDLLVELCGKSFPMSKMNDVQFADWVRLCVGLRPLSCGDDSRGRRNGKTKVNEVDSEPENTTADEPEENDDVVEAATEVKTEAAFTMEDREVVIAGRLQVMAVKVYR